MKLWAFLMIPSSLAISGLNAKLSAQVAPQHYRVSAAEAPTHSVTPDGRFRLYSEEVPGGGDHLFVRNLTTGISHPLTEEAGTAAGALLSPDGRYVVFVWVTPAYEWPAEDRRVELRLMEIDGSVARVLYSNKDSDQPGSGQLNMILNPPLLIHEWSPNGQSVAVTLYQEEQAQMVLFSAIDGAVRVLQTQGLEALSYRSYGDKMKFSPDGELVAYEVRPNGSASRDIFVGSVEGGSLVPLVQHRANDILLDWTPDGSGILFASDRSGQWDLWVAPWHDAFPLDSPQMVVPKIGHLPSGLGFTPDGSYYYGVTVGESDVYTATLDPGMSRLGPPSVVASHVGTRTSAQWSRDGRYLAYAWGAGSEDDPFVLGIAVSATGEERRLPLGALRRHGGHGFDPQWSPDGRFILADARENGYVQGQGLYRIDVHTGNVAPIVLTEVASGYSRIESPAWAPDGRVIFEQRPPQRIMIRDLQTGTERELYRPVPPSQVHHWPTSNLAVSPDGQRLAFVWTDANPQEQTTALMIISIAGGAPRELLRARSPNRIGVPAWTHDSRHIIYARNLISEGEGFTLWRVSAEGGEPQYLGLKMDGRVPYGLSVHPDGTRIAFTAGTERRREVWVLKDFLPGQAK